MLDVRTQEEYDAGHIDGARLLPYDAITAESPGLPTDKNAVVIVYCRSGSRSGAAASTLSDLGYTRIYNLGGLVAGHTISWKIAFPNHNSTKTRADVARVVSSMLAFILFLCRKRLCFVLHRQRIDHFVHVAVQKLFQLIQRQRYPVIRHASLREVVRADALTSVS